MRIVTIGAVVHIASRWSRKIAPAYPEAKICLIDNLSTQRSWSLFHRPAKERYRFGEADELITSAPVSGILAIIASHVPDISIEYVDAPVMNPFQRQRV